MSDVISNPKWMTWTGRVLSTLPVLMICMGLVMLAMHPEMTKEMSKYGYPEGAGKAILPVEVACVVLYLIPQTAVFGAILLTAYFGGAVATHVIGREVFAAPIIVCAVFWFGLYFREPRLRAIVFWRQ